MPADGRDGNRRQQTAERYADLSVQSHNYTQWHTEVCAIHVHCDVNTVNVTVCGDVSSSQYIKLQTVNIAHAVETVDIQSNYWMS